MIIIIISVILSVIFAIYVAVDELDFVLVFPFVIIGAFIGLMLAAILPADLENIKTNSKIIPINNNYSVGCNKEYYYVQIKDDVSFHMERFDCEKVKIIYDSTYTISVYKNHKIESLWNHFAIDFDHNSVTKVIVKVPENTIMAYDVINN